MIGAWLAQTPVVFVAVVVIFGPGLLIGWLLHLRGLALWALAPVGSTAVVALLAFAYGAVGLRWSALSAGVGCLVVAALAAVGGRLLGSRAVPRVRARHTERWMLTAGLLIGMLTITAQFVVYVGHPDTISQTNDAVFHLNALRYILDTGNASSMHISGFLGADTFYPAAWHGLASLVILTAGCSIPVAANVTTLVISAGVWPVGLAWLTARVMGGRLVPAAVGAALSGAMWAFPMLMVEWGVLYPYGLSVALLPAAAALVIVAPAWAYGLGPARTRVGNRVLTGVLMLAAAGALALAQPASLLTWLLIVAIFATWHVAQRMPHATGAARAQGIVGLVVMWVVLAVVWWAFAHGTSRSQWVPFRSHKHAVFDVFANSQVMLPPALGISILMLIGLAVAVLRRRLRWFATTWLAIAVLYVLVASAGRDSIRNGLLRPWYADPYRFAALAPLVAVPLATIGLLYVVHWATTAISTRRMNTAARFSAAWCLVGVAALSGVTLALRPVVQMPRITEGTPAPGSLYTDMTFLTRDGRAMLEDLDRLTPADARIIGNPSTGVAFGYFLSDRDVYPRTWQAPDNPTWDTIAQHLREAAYNPIVCPALKKMGSPQYVLDFGPGMVLPGRWLMPGLTAFVGKPGFTLVKRIGHASLWHITACAS